TAGSTAESFIAVALHLHQVGSGGCQDIPRLLVNIVVTTEHTGVMISQFGSQSLLRFNLALGDKPGNQLCIVIDLELSTLKLWIFVLERVVAVRTGGDNFLDPIVVKCFDVGGNQH